jgi:polyhydroxyalkanoate synthase
LLKEFQTLVEASARQPQLILAQQAELAREYMAILSGTSKLTPEPNDKRFREAEWSDNWFYKTCLQGYLAWARGLDNLVGKLGFDEKDMQRRAVCRLTCYRRSRPIESLLDKPRCAETFC